ncbi:competence type IV pilus assembly protein ComGB [Oceanobacillus bengalensis]|uniref:Chromosome partitioning protein ParA n=1 Tax=Oceanobacillus bengalensis TaxID=1435466 RepID=A0A494Z0J6_9BACI|nr:competence type IV pilus assembly protein ComGB [Oceanobacillus bengalensis]RKQ16022.1 chromosome partitioning protein ParA [Oceanobacillus bengalensis]
MDLSLKKFIQRKQIIKKENQLRFLNLFLRLLKNGYPTLDALEAMKWDKSLLKPANEIIHALKAGETIDEAFEKAGFHPTITSFLYFVKVNSDLQGSIEQCIIMYKQRLTNTKKLQQILRYPLFLFIIFFLLIYFLNQTILPSFVDLFQGNEDSSSTVVLSMYIIDVVSTFLFILLLFVIVFIFVWKLIKQRIPIETQIKIYKQIPVYRKFITAYTSYFFATHFSSLLKTGMSIKEILHQMANQQKLPILSHYSFIMIERLTNGVHISGVISSFTLLEKPLTTIFQKNTDAYFLEKDLVVYAELQLEEIENKILRAITFIQPIIFIVLGIFVIFIYVALMWPMFQLMNTI